MRTFSRVKTSHEILHQGNALAQVNLNIYIFPPSSVIGRGDIICRGMWGASSITRTGFHRYMVVMYVFIERHTYSYILNIYHVCSLYTCTRGD